MMSRFALAVAGVLLSASAHATVVLSDNFNTENGGVGAFNYANFANFNVTSGSVDLIGNGFSDFLPGNGLYVDLDGSTGAAGTLATKQAFAPGTYSLSFDLAGSQRGPAGVVTVAFGSLDQTITLGSSVGFTTETFNVTISDPAGLTLSFASDVPGNVGALLDNVVLSTSGSGGSGSGAAVPEPASLAVLAIGLIGLGVRRRRHG